jgi:hypothetical protein
MAISKRWKLPETEYRKWHQSKDKFELGEVQFVHVENDTWVGNMIGQRNIKTNSKGILRINICGENRHHRQARKH